MSTPTRPPHWQPVAVLAACASVVVWLQGFPVQPVLLGLGLFALALTVAWRPWLLWWWVPALLPVLDLAPWSGRLYFDEFDALLAVLLPMAWWRSPAATTTPPDRRLRLALCAVVASCALSALHALWPWPGMDANAFIGLLSPFSGLRAVRGAAWALLLWALYRRQRAAGWNVSGAFGNGMVLGLLGAVLFIIGERVAFTHWLDVADTYRVAGPFSAMHIGGAYVECYLVATLPFLVVRLWPPAPAWRLAAGAVLLAAAVYAVMVTFSRGGYVALALAMLLTLLATARQRGRPVHRALTGTAIAAITVAAAWPVLMGGFAQSRLATVNSDLLVREDHWTRTVALMDAGAPSWLLGMGMGQFPATLLMRSTAEQRSASFRLGDDAGQRFLRLGGGQPVFIDQAVASQPGQSYQLRAKLRSTTPGASLTVSLCEKWLVASARCSIIAIAAGPGSGEWRSLTQPLNSAEVGAAPAGRGRPVKLSVFNSGSATVDLASIELVDADGRALLRNGGFSDGMDHWFFTSDDHLAWHAKSMPIALLFDQGVLGLLAFGGLLALALVRAARAAWSGQAESAPLLAALAAFAAVGLVDTLIDTPRFLMLWLLLCCLAADTRPAASISTR